MLSRASHLTFWIGSLVILSFLSWMALSVTILHNNPIYHKRKCLSIKKHKFIKNITKVCTIYDKNGCLKQLFGMSSSTSDLESIGANLIKALSDGGN